MVQKARVPRKGKLGEHCAGKDQKKNSERDRKVRYFMKGVLGGGVGKRAY